MNVALQPTTTNFERGSFRGNAGEYFGIWIVNVLLTIITLGIYSAWAKVRRNRYFYGNSVLLDHSFDYHATGKQIFIGRLIVFVYLLIYNITLQISPIAGGILAIGILISLPWLIARSLRFNMRVTSYRNVRFDFVGKTGGAFFAFFVGGIVSVLSLGLLAPFATRWLNRYIFNNIRYGGRSLETGVTTRQIYGAWLLPALLVALGGAIIALAAFNIMPQGVQLDNANIPPEHRILLQSLLTFYFTMIPVLIVYALAGIIYRIAVRNAVLTSSLFDGKHPLMSDLGRRRYVWILFSNTIVSILTLGLMRPWAAVREQRYLLEHFGIAIVGNVGEVMSDIEKSGSAISAEYMDMDGFDFGF